MSRIGNWLFNNSDAVTICGAIVWVVIVLVAIS